MDMRVSRRRRDTRMHTYMKRAYSVDQGRESFKKGEATSIRHGARASLRAFLLCCTSYAPHRHSLSLSLYTPMAFLFLYYTRFGTFTLVASTHASSASPLLSFFSGALSRRVCARVCLGIASFLLALFYDCSLRLRRVYRNVWDTHTCDWKGACNVW